MTFQFLIDVHLQLLINTIMKSTKLLIFILIASVIISCSSDNNNKGNDFTNFNSQICNTITGPTAAYWDYANGVPPPFNEVPILSNPGSQFIHSQQPYLGLIIPQGYTAFEDQNPQTLPLGVNVIRNDNAVVWRYVPLASFPNNFSVNDILATEINGMFNFYGFNGTNFEVLCQNNPPPTIELGIKRTFSSRLIRFGNFTGLVWVSVVQVEGLPTLSVSSSVSSGPTNEFNNLAMDVFLPLSFQLLVNESGTLSDRDGDGVPDVYDSEPDNPNVH